MSLRTELGGEEIATSGDGTRDSANNVNANRGTCQLAALTDGEPTPDAELLIMDECVLQALTPHITARADLLGLARGGAHLGEECIRVGLCAESLIGPRLIDERERRML
jgi:hypothetical protein